MIPSYTKVLTLGSYMTERALIDTVVIQEKIDGSQFCFGLNCNGELLIRSHNAQINIHEPQKMFRAGVDYILSIEDIIKENFEPDTYFYCEYLQKPKHNVLNYSSIPQNHIVLFDALRNKKWVKRKELEEIAFVLHIDCIPELFAGEISCIEDLKKFHEVESYLGGEKIEGVVIKNYGENIILNGKVFPLITKYVRESFKERHKAEWKVKGNALEDYKKGFKSEARWQKAIQHLQEIGELENSPRDIGVLMKRINLDIIEEEAENIKEDLYKMFIKDILRNATKGFAEWYKEKLLERMETNC